MEWVNPHKRRNTIIKNMQSGRFACLIVMLVLGCFSITSISLLARSDKKTELEDSLTVTGDYDEIIYNVDIGFEDNLSELEYIEDIGLYYELGTVSNVNETKNFKAISFKDELSEDIYHMSCIRGIYPRNENEIAIDVSVANAYGIASYPGEVLNLKLYDSNGEYIETKEFVVSGVFQCSKEEVINGWTRCPSFAFYNDLYQMPAVYFYNPDLNTWSCSKETVFFRASSVNESVLYGDITRVLNKSELTCSGFESNGRKFMSYPYYAGWGFGEGTYSFDDINQDILDGKFKRDFYSAIVTPVISVLVIVIEVLSIYMLSKNIIADRKDHYATLRSIGMSAKRIIRNLVLELFGFGLGGAAVGIGLGYACHLLVIKVLNDKLHLRLYDGIHVEQIIKRITYSPVAVSLSVCICSLALALIVPLYRLYKMYPAELLSTTEGAFVGKKKRRRQKTAKFMNWLGLLNERINLHDAGTAITMVIVLTSALFGYVFFRGYSDMATVEARNGAESIGVDGNGYVVSRASYLVDWGYNVTNRHDAGIVPSFPVEIENNPNVNNSWSVVFNHSTRMVFEDEPDVRLQALLGNRLLNCRPSFDPYMSGMYEAENTVFECCGFDADTIMYELPTVGLTVNELLKLDDEILEGEIDVDKVRSGEEIVLAVPEELKDICLQYYPIGSAITFDDIVLTEEEEKLNFQTLNDPKWVVYEKDIGNYHNGYAAFGTRYSVNSVVGAIVVLSDRMEIDEYLTAGTGWERRLFEFGGRDYGDTEPTIGMSVLCLAQTFESWGLPDRNFTSVRVELNDSCDIYEFNEFWYKALSDSVDVETKSTFDYLYEINIGRMRVMSFFYIMLFTLIALGTVSIITGLYATIGINTGRFQILRRIGLSVRQASLMIYTQNMFYPIIATLLAIIPISIVQCALGKYRVKWGAGLITEYTPWGGKMPIMADLFSYDFIPAVFCCLLLGYVLIVIGTLPQILYLKKMKMIETRED